MSQKYWDLLGTPEWKARRREMLEAAGNRCQECGRDQEAMMIGMEVHHRYYQSGLKPWEYPDSALIVLCRTCHSRTQTLLNNLRRSLGLLSYDQLEAVEGFVSGTAMKRWRTGIACLDDPIRLWAFEAAFGIPHGSISPRRGESALGEWLYTVDEIFEIEESRKPKRHDPSYV